MAHLIRKKIATTKNKKRIYKESVFWYIRYKDINGKWKERKAFKDKVASIQLMAKLEKKIELQQAGIIDKYEEDRKRPLQEHLLDFKNSLLNKGNTNQHVNLTYNRAKAIIEGCKFIFIGDIKPSTIEKYLADLRRQDLSIQSSNHYLQAIKQFCKWLVVDGRTGENSIQHLKGQNAQLDKRHERRALTEQEINKLMSVTLRSRKHHNMTGQERAWLYLLAVNTGLRAGELASLIWRSFNLGDPEPFLVVSVGHSKRRREDKIPLREDVAQLFSNWQKERDESSEAKVFPGFNENRGADMLEWTWKRRKLLISMMLDALQTSTV